MSGPAEQSRTGWTTGLVLLVLPLLYVLSIGPAARVVERCAPQWNNALLVVYFPVIWLHDHTPLAKPLEMYVKLWGVRP